MENNSIFKTVEEVIKSRKGSRVSPLGRGISKRTRNNIDTYETYFSIVNKGNRVKIHLGNYSDIETAKKARVKFINSLK